MLVKISNIFNTVFSAASHRIHLEFKKKKTTKHLSYLNACLRVLLFCNKEFLELEEHSLLVAAKGSQVIQKGVLDYY